MAHSTQSSLKQDVTQQLIRALEELEGRPRQRTQHALAEKAIRSLSFDFPLVTEIELLALADTLRDGLQGKAGPGPLAYCITHKVLENVTQGARGPNPTATTTAAATPSWGRQHGSMPAVGNSSSSQAAVLVEASTAASAPANGSNGISRDVALVESSSSEGAPASAASPATQAVEAARLKLGYQRVVCVLLLQLVQHLLAMPEQDAWRVVQGLAQPFPERDDNERSTSMQQAVAASMLTSGSGEQSADELSSGFGIGEAEASAHEDPDDFEFEPLEPSCSTAAAQNLPASITSSSSHAALLGIHTANGALVQGPPYSWSALHAVLLLLASHVDYSLMDAAALWQDGSTADVLMQAVRTLGAHAQAVSLAPLLHAYAGLLVDHLLHQPAQVALLTHFWDAIGAPTLAIMSRKPAAKQVQPAQLSTLAECLPVPVAGEALLAFNMAASLGAQLTSAGARSGLWQALHSCLLPLVVRSLSDLAAVLPAPTAASCQPAAAVVGPADSSAGVSPGMMAAMGSVCQVVVLYLQLRPGNMDASATLQQQGALAPLARLFLAVGTHAAAEPLRQALLCCAAASGACARWLLAVPGTASFLQGAAFADGGQHQLHGAIWDLLIPQQAATCEGSIGACASSGVRLQAVLADCESAQGVMRLHTFLQLYTTAAACSGATDGALCLAPLLTRSAQGALSRLLKHEGLTALAGPGINCEGASQGSAESALVSSPCGEGTSDEGLPAASSSAQEQDARPEGSLPLTIHYAEDADLAKNVVLGHEQLQARRALQLQPACVRMLKLLCMAGESKTD